MLNRPLISGKIGKWSLALTELTFIYYPQKAVKGQALADFVADHHDIDVLQGIETELPVYQVDPQPWVFHFDGSSTESSAGAGVVRISPLGTKTVLSLNLDFTCTNNQAEYEALVIGLEILQELGAKEVVITGDSQLVLKQLSGESVLVLSLCMGPFSSGSPNSSSALSSNLQPDSGPC